MRIEISDLRFETIIGVLDFERQEEQEIVVDLKIDYRYREGNFLDYAQIAQEVQEHLRSRRYELLEEALLGLESLLTARHPDIQRLECRITKPHILPHARVSVTREWTRG
ncbi:dihydroneopterin aldolase [Nitratifractor sp.]